MPQEPTITNQPPPQGYDLVDSLADIVDEEIPQPNLPDELPVPSPGPGVYVDPEWRQLGQAMGAIESPPSTIARLKEALDAANIFSKKFEDENKALKATIETLRAEIASLEQRLQATQATPVIAPRRIQP